MPIRAFTSRSDDAQSSSVVSIDAPAIHGLPPWRPIDSEFQVKRNCNAKPVTRLARISTLLAADRLGHTLSQQFYVGQDAFAFDTEVMLKSVWLYACTVAHVKKPGDYFRFDLAHNSVIIVRGRDGEVRAFYNSCRHRGARLCERQTGHSARLTCPYHQWTYRLGGNLLAAQYGARFRPSRSWTGAGRA